MDETVGLSTRTAKLSRIRGSRLIFLMMFLLNVMVVPTFATTIAEEGKACKIYRTQNYVPDDYLNLESTIITADKTMKSTEFSTGIGLYIDANDGQTTGYEEPYSNLILYWQVHDNQVVNGIDRIVIRWFDDYKTDISLIAMYGEGIEIKLGEQDSSYPRRFFDLDYTLIAVYFEKNRSNQMKNVAFITDGCTANVEYPHQQLFKAMWPDADINEAELRVMTYTINSQSQWTNGQFDSSEQTKFEAESLVKVNSEAKKFELQFNIEGNDSGCKGTLKVDYDGSEVTFSIDPNKKLGYQYHEYTVTAKSVLKNQDFGSKQFKIAVINHYIEPCINNIQAELDYMYISVAYQTIKYLNDIDSFCHNQDICLAQQTGDCFENQSEGQLDYSSGAYESQQFRFSESDLGFIQESGNQKCSMNIYSSVSFDETNTSLVYLPIYYELRCNVKQVYSNLAVVNLDTVEDGVAQTINLLDDRDWKFTSILCENTIGIKVSILNINEESNTPSTLQANTLPFDYDSAQLIIRQDSTNSNRYPMTINVETDDYLYYGLYQFLYTIVYLEENPNSFSFLTHDEFDPVVSKDIRFDLDCTKFDDSQVIINDQSGKTADKLIKMSTDTGIKIQETLVISSSRPYGIEWECLELQIEESSEADDLIEEGILKLNEPEDSQDEKMYDIISLAEEVLESTEVQFTFKLVYLESEEVLIQDTVTFVLEVFQSEQTFVVDTNQKPSFEPAISPIDIRIGEIQEFKVTVTDPEQDQISLSYKLQATEPFVTVASSDVEVTFTIAPTRDTAAIKEYSISLIITEIVESTGVTNKVKETLTINVQDDTDVSEYYIDQAQGDDQDDGNGNKSKTPLDSDSQTKLEPITAEVTDVNAIGQVIIEYSQPVEVISDYTEQIEENDNIIKAKLNINQETEDNLTEGFSYNMTLFNSTQIHINFYFGNPLEISKGSTPDTISLELLQSFFFNRQPQSSSRLLQVPGEKYYAFEIELPRLVSSKEELEQLQSVGGAASVMFDSTFWAPFILQLFLSVSLSMIWNMFNLLQLVVSFTYFQVLMPSNVTLIQNEFQSIVNLDLFPREQIYELTVGKFFQISEDQDYKSNLMMQAGYVVIGVVLVLLLIGLMTLIECMLMKRCCNFCQVLWLMLKRKLMFNSILRALIQSYLATSISCLFALGTIKMDGNASWETKFNWIFSVLVLLFLLAFPNYQYKFQRQFRSELRTKEYIESYGTLYQNLNLYKLQALPFTLIFLYRRLFFAFTAVALCQLIQVQVAATNWLSVMVLSYYWRVMPMCDGINNAIQIINEVFFLFFSCYLFIFTDYVVSAKDQQFLGYLYIYIIFAAVTCNLIALIVTIISTICHKIKARRKKLNMIYQWAERREQQQKMEEAKRLQQQQEQEQLSEERPDPERKIKVLPRLSDRDEQNSSRKIRLATRAELEQISEVSSHEVSSNYQEDRLHLQFSPKLLQLEEEENKTTEAPVQLLTPVQEPTPEQEPETSPVPVPVPIYQQILQDPEAKKEEQILLSSIQPVSLTKWDKPAPVRKVSQDISQQIEEKLQEGQSDGDSNRFVNRLFLGDSPKVEGHLQMQFDQQSSQDSQKQKHMEELMDQGYSKAEAGAFIALGVKQKNSYENNNSEFEETPTSNALSRSREQNTFDRQKDHHATSSIVSKQSQQYEEEKKKNDLIYEDRIEYSDQTPSSDLNNRIENSEDDEDEPGLDNWLDLKIRQTKPPKPTKNAQKQDRSKTQVISSDRPLFSFINRQQ